MLWEVRGPAGLDPDPDPDPSRSRTVRGVWGEGVSHWAPPPTPLQGHGDEGPASPTRNGFRADGVQAGPGGSSLLQTPSVKTRFGENWGDRNVRALFC